MPFDAHINPFFRFLSVFLKYKYNVSQTKCQKMGKMKAAIDKEVLFYYDMFVKREHGSAKNIFRTARHNTGGMETHLPGK